MRINRIGLVLSLTTSMVVAPVGGAMAATPAGEPFQKALDAIVTSGSVAAIGEIRNGDKVWRGSSGTATVGGRRPATVDGRFRAGSVTKSFTATVVLQLVGEGRLSLDDSVERWLPGLVAESDDITIRHLLQHRSGLPEYGEDLFAESGLPKERYRTWKAKELVAMAERRPHGFRPGARYEYSNTNYIVLGMIIEKATGRPYGSEITERVLRPLGLKHTWLPGASTRVKGLHPHAYVAVGKKPVDVTTLNPTMAGAAGSIISTTADLNTFFRALLGGKLLPPAQLKAMTDAGTTKEYGLGLEVVPLPCGTAYGHGGGIVGYLTVSYTSADGSRQVSLAMTPLKGDPKVAVTALLTKALCP